VSISNKSRILINFLAKKFNTTVSIVNDPEVNEFAYIKGGEVYINIAKNPEGSENIDKYIVG